jgi:hypothetical protein
MLTGKSYGVTNVQVMDAAGRTILNREIEVAGSDRGMVTLYRGVKGQNYTCSPGCQPGPETIQAPAASIAPGAPAAIAAAATP